jgi:8-oxo-dGTP pyrophosphatase MutT (NUDIX family)
VQQQGSARHLVTPRTLVFCERGGRRLFIEGGPRKWFAGRLNGLGGSVERGEDVGSSAAREVEEECGLRPADLRLRAVVHVDDDGDADPQVMLFVFTASLPEGDVRASDEGRLLWLTPAEVADPSTPLLPDVRGLLAAIDDVTPRTEAGQFTVPRNS